MKKECINAINSKAGRELTKSELDAIEEHIRSAYSTLKNKNPDAFYAMSKRERYLNAAQIAKERMVQGRVDAHMRSLANAKKTETYFNTVKALPKGKALDWTIQKWDKIDANARSEAEAIFQTIDREALHILQDRTNEQKVLSALLGETDSPEYNKYAKELKKLTDEVHTRLNDAGIHVNYIENFVPQELDAANLNAVLKSEAVNDLYDHIKPEVFLKPDGTKRTEEEIKDIIGKTYDNITTGGKLEEKDGDPFKGRRRPALDTTRNRTRYFQYKNAESQRFIMGKYGTRADLYSTYVDYVSRAGKDIALAKEMGTNPRDTYMRGLAIAEKIDKQSDVAVPQKITDKQNAKIKLAQQSFETFVNPGNIGNATWARRAATVRAAISLGTTGNIFSALPDLAVMKVMYGVHNIPFIRGMKDALKFAINGKETKLLANNIGLVMDDIMHNVGRFSADVIKPGLIQKLSAAHQWLSGLHAFDRGIKSGVQTSVLNIVGEMSLRHENLEAAMGDSAIVSHIGMTQAHWDGVRASELIKGPDGDRTIASSTEVMKVPLEKWKEILDKNNQSTDSKYAEVIGEIKRKIGNVYDKIAVANADFQSRKIKIKSKLDDYVEWIGRKSEFSQDLKEAHIEEINALRERADADYELQQELLRGKQDAGNSMQLQAISDAIKLQKEKATNAIYKGTGNIAKFAVKTNDNADARVHRETGKIADRIGAGFDKVDNKVSAIDLKLTDKNNRYTDTQINKAIKYANKIADLNARITKAEYRINELEKTQKQKTDLATKKSELKINDMVKELKNVINKHEQNLNRLNDYLGEFEKHKFQASDVDARRLRNDTAVKLMSLAQYFSHRMARGAHGPNTIERAKLDMSASGTISGEFQRFAYQFLQIPLGIMRSHMTQLSEIGGTTNKAKYIASTVAWMTVAGAAAQQIKALLRGEDPKNMNPTTKKGVANLLESMVRGGALGYGGDILLGTSSGVANLGGPAIGIADKLLSEKHAGLKAIFSDKETKHSFKVAGAKMVGGLVPFSHISYLNGGFNHLVYNRLMDWIQPGYSDKKEKKFIKEGGSYYWPPSKALPQRLPNFSTAIKGSSQ